MRPESHLPLATEVPLNARGRCYHIDCGKGDLAPYIMTCGDPVRAGKIARRFDKVTVRRRNREFVTYTGIYHGIPVSVMATGIGVDNTAIAVIEAAQCIAPATFIRLGTCGALQPEIAPGELVITECCLRDEQTTRYYAPPKLEVRAHPAVRAALVEAAIQLGVPYHTGLTCTSADFYGGQGREAPGFPILDPAKVARLRRLKVLNLEMEMSAYLTLAAISSLNLRAGGACVVFANRITGDTVFSAVGQKSQAERRLIDVGFLALKLVSSRDRG